VARICRTYVKVHKHGAGPFLVWARAPWPPPTSGAVNVVCFEWSVINRSVLKGNHTHFEREPYTSWQNWGYSYKHVISLTLAHPVV